MKWNIVAIFKTSHIFQRVIARLVAQKKSNFYLLPSSMSDQIYRCSEGPTLGRFTTSTAISYKLYKVHY